MIALQTVRNRLRELAVDWRRARAAHPRTSAGVLAVFVFIVISSSTASAWLLWTARRVLPGEAALDRIGEMDQATTVYDADGRLAFTLFKEQRIDVPLSAVSPRLVAALIAIEDQRFYQHRGVDVVRIASAALVNVRAGRAAQGGSTITQQLARQSFLTTDKTLRRKVQELMLAVRLERRLSKARILELYLNKVYFGDGLYGAEAAARGYFGKHASDISLAEAALLAGLVKSPSTYAPTVSLERAVGRRDVVLRVMFETGAIDRAAWNAAQAEQVALADGLRADDLHGQYFKEQVRRDLVERFGWGRVYQGGLRVYSTIDMAAQSAAEAAVHDALTALDRRRLARISRHRPPEGPQQPAAPEPVLQAALLALDPRSGEVRAMVGGRSFAASPFNRAVQARRQPGSAFKPFVYAAAIDAGYTPATVIRNLNTPVETLQGAWTPEDEHSSDDSMPLRTALRTSSNRAAVRLLQDVGIDRTVEYAKKLGVGDVPSVPSLALGSGEVTLAAMTAAYAAFANRGLLAPPRFIRRVEDHDGQVLYTNDAPPVRVLSETTAFLMTSLLADVIDSGTAATARRLGFMLPAAGKTGTTNDFNDAWFIGYTPTLAAGVWVGFDKPQTILPNGFASEVAVPLWTAFMKPATRRDGPRTFTPPAGVTTARICRESGLVATDACEHASAAAVAGDPSRHPLVYTEYFARGTQPTTSCDVHASRSLLGTLAAVFRGDRRADPQALVGRTQGAASGSFSMGAHAADRAKAPVASGADAPGADSSGADSSGERRGFWSRLFGRREGRDKK